MKCKSCGRFIPKDIFFCDMECHNRFLTRKFSIQELREIQLSYSPNCPINLRKIIRSVKNKKMEEEFYKKNDVEECLKKKPTLQLSKK